MLMLLLYVAMIRTAQVQTSTSVAVWSTVVLLLNVHLDPNLFKMQALHIAKAFNAVMPTVTLVARKMLDVILTLSMTDGS
jgi:hypothetical protein